jgi:uncharacterized protein HemX
MKPIRIGFIEDKQWIVDWIVTAVACAIIVGAGGWRWRQDQLRIQAHEAQLAEARKKAAELQAKANVPDPYKAQKDAMRKLLQTDLNKVFAVIENVDVPGARLRSMDLDAAGNVMRLEYELDAIARVSDVSAALNAGYENGPWQLGSVAATGSSQAGAQPPKFRGYWSAAVDRL